MRSMEYMDESEDTELTCPGPSVNHQQTSRPTLSSGDAERADQQSSPHQTIGPTPLQSMVSTPHQCIESPPHQGTDSPPHQEFPTQFLGQQLVQQSMPPSLYHSNEASLQQPKGFHAPSTVSAQHHIPIPSQQAISPQPHQHISFPPQPTLSFFPQQHISLSSQQHIKPSPQAYLPPQITNHHGLPGADTVPMQISFTEGLRPSPMVKGTLRPNVPCPSEGQKVENAILQLTEEIRAALQRVMSQPGASSRDGQLELARGESCPGLSLPRLSTTVRA